jgi:hypothetical protein
VEENAMAFEVESRHLGEVVVLAAKAYEDARGYFMEAYREDQFLELGLPGIFVQDKEGSGAGAAFPVGAADGEIDASNTRGGISGCGGFAGWVAHPGEMGGDRSDCGESEAGVGAGEFCAGILRVDGRRRGAIQVHRHLQREGGISDSMG